MWDRNIYKIGVREMQYFKSLDGKNPFLCSFWGKAFRDGGGWKL